jgi:hypothetical protein
MRSILAILLAIVYSILLVESRTFPLLGGYQAQTQIDENAMEIAKWATVNLPEYTKVNGEYSLLTIRDLRTQVVSGMNYKFTLDLLLGTPEYKYYVSKITTFDFFLYINEYYTFFRNIFLDIVSYM